MPWKEDGKGGLAVENGAPVWVAEDGDEKRVDYEAMTKRLADVTKESIERKNRLREHEATLKQLEGIEDVTAFLAKARKDAETVASLSEKEKGAEKAARIRVEAALKPREAPDNLPADGDWPRRYKKALQHQASLQGFFYSLFALLILYIKKYILVLSGGNADET